METLLLATQASEDGFPWGGLIIVIGLVWACGAICEALKPKGYTVREESKKTVTPHK